MIDIEIQEFIKSVCSKNHWNASNKTLSRNLERYYKSEKKFNLKRNDKLLSELDVMQHPSFPSGPVTVGCLIGYWHIPSTNQELAHVSGQIAKQAQTLRESGFIFRTEEKKDGHTKYNWTFHLPNGKEVREIIGFDPTPSVADANWNKLKKTERMIIKKVFNKDVLGIGFQPRDGEIDHRMPEIMRKNKGIKATPLTRATIIDGIWDNDYQVLSKQTNNQKREACNKCLKGEDIEVPFAICPNRSAYKAREDEDNKGCLGCFWYDPLRPKNPRLLYDLDSAKQLHQKKLQEVSRLLNNV